jgi:hypothetical protein
MPKIYRAALDLAALLDASTAGELISELSRYGPQKLIEIGSPPFWVQIALSAPTSRSGSASATASAP